MMYKTTKRHFDLFQREAEYWIDYFGLHSYRWAFFHTKLEGSLASFQVHKSAEDRVARLTLATLWRVDEPTDYMVRQSAFHEILEALFFELRNVFAWNNVWGAVIDMQIHTIIRVMENTLFRKRYNHIVS